MKPSLGALLALALASCDAPLDSRPPVLLVSLDACRADHMSLYGYERPTTPYLERLAEESLVVDRAHCTAPWTLTSHMTMFTGLYPTQHGVNETSALSPEVPTLAERLRERGYDTLGFYRAPGWIDSRYGFDRGFRVFEPHTDGEEALDHVRGEIGRRHRRTPFFLFLHLFDTHCGDLDRSASEIYLAPEPYSDMFLPGARDRLRGLRADDVWVGKAPLDTHQREAIVALYDGSIRYVDSLLESLVEEWRADGILDRAFLVVTADHGEGLGQRSGKLEGHGEMYQEGLRVPLLIRSPGGRGHRLPTPVSHVDLVPTILDLLGLPVDPWLPGYSLKQGRPPTAPLLAERSQVYAILRMPWKLIASTRTRGASIFNLQKDPEELDPLPSKPKSKRYERLRERLENLRADLLRRRPGPEKPAVPIETMSEEERDQIRALGYGGA
jgi:arylsulfatase